MKDTRRQIKIKGITIYQKIEKCEKCGIEVVSLKEYEKARKLLERMKKLSKK